MKTFVIILALILLGFSGYYTYQHFSSNNNSASPAAEPTVPGLTYPLDKAQNSVHNYGDKVQQQTQYGQ
jgi:hypothetical protein